MVTGTLGYLSLGLDPLDALYQTVTTIATVGFRELPEEPSANFRIFTMGLILTGVGTALYTATVLLESVVEGRLTDRIGRRRMQRTIDDLTGHVVLCGWGRVGRTIERHLQMAGEDVVVVETDLERYDVMEGLKVWGDATDDKVMTQAGIERAAVLVTAVDSDADNLFVALSARARCPELFIVSRVRDEANEAKLRQAGADRVINPQQIGGGRMAALARSRNVADFLDVVMHDGSLEFRLEDVAVPGGSTLAGKTLREAQVRDTTGALVLAIRDGDGEFATNPGPDTVLSEGDVLIAIGTEEQLEQLVQLADH
ncbi:MAG TPA: potassium channel protein [Acidimicrobiales bacterium]|nr:potassium channel protein [Acidimicrobiales bacterium]